MIENLEERVVPYTLSGSKWASVSVSASFMPDGTITDGGLPSTLFNTLNPLTTAAWQREYARALQTWASVTPLNFRFVSDNGAAAGISGSTQGDSRFGDIRLGAYASATWSGYAYFPGGGTLGGDMFVNSAVTWHIGTSPDLYTILLHETGHALGLDHTSVYPAVMRPSISTVYTGLYADDIAGIQAIYGARQADAYDAGAGNNGFPTASALSLSGGAVSFNADLTSIADVDFYRVTAPSSFDGTLSVSVDARNLSLLTPKISVYDAAFNLLGSVSASSYAGVATINLGGLAAGQTYYLVPDGATGDVFGVGTYKFTAQFGGVAALPTLSINNVSVAEGNSGASVANFTVALSSASTSTVTVQYASVNGTATSGSDYASVGGTLTFAPGETQKSVAVTIYGDTAVEPNENFVINLSSPTNANLGVSQGQGTIQNDDASTPSLSISNVSATEGDSGSKQFNFIVALSAATTNTVTVQYATANGSATAGSDYASVSSTLTFAPGETQKTVSVMVYGDTAVEANETFVITLANPVNATVAASQGTGTVTNDDMAADRYEVNDTATVATNFGNTNTVSQSNLTLHTASDQDYYTFTNTKKGTYKVTLTPTQVGGTLNVAVLNASQAVLASGQSTSGSVVVTVSLAAGQKYFVRASSASGSRFTYSVSVGKPGGAGGAAILEFGDEATVGAPVDTAETRPGSASFWAIAKSSNVDANDQANWFADAPKQGKDAGATEDAGTLLPATAKKADPWAGFDAFWPDDSAPLTEDLF
jgi:hypothetical protein